MYATECFSNPPELNEKSPHDNHYLCPWPPFDLLAPIHSLKEFTPLSREFGALAHPFVYSIIKHNTKLNTAPNQPYIHVTLIITPTVLATNC